ncbi:MAG: MFS transporter [Phycisphaerales bacterium]|nr:MFS transporter [Phycisphaerales bacterium]
MEVNRISQTNSEKLFSTVIIICSLGYFIDVFDIMLFSVYRLQSFKDLGMNLNDHPYIFQNTTKILNYQMCGALLGGIFWGILGDKKGRLKILYFSIALYSITCFLTAFVHNVEQYAILRCITGFGLAGEVGIGVTLASELLPQQKRGLAGGVMASVGILGVIGAYLSYKLNIHWRTGYALGGVLGFMLLLIRTSMHESTLFKSIHKQPTIIKGNLLFIVNKWKRLKKYLLLLGLSLFTWFAIGILITSNEQFAKLLFPNNSINYDPTLALVLYAIGSALGEITVAILSQRLKSRRKSIVCFIFLQLLVLILYFSNFNNSTTKMYICCLLIGIGSGYWSIFLVVSSELFGTNLRATVATSIPNFARGSLVLTNFLFQVVGIKWLHFTILQSALYLGIGICVLSFICVSLIPETFSKNLDYIEQ